MPEASKQEEDISRTEEWSKEMEEEFANARKVIEALAPLANSEGWQLIQRLLATQIQSRQLTGIAPSKDIGGLLEREFRAGEVAGLTLAANIVARVLEGAKALAKEYQEMQNPKEQEPDND